MKGIIEGTIPNEELKIKDTYDINNPPFIQTNPLDEVDLYKSQQESMKGIIGGNVYDPKQQPSNINEDTISRSSKIPIEFESCNLNYLQLMVEEPVESVIKIDKINVPKDKNIYVSIPQNISTYPSFGRKFEPSTMLFESMNYPVVPEPKLRQSKPIIPLTTNQGRMFQLQKLDLTDPLAKFKKKKK